MGAVPKLLPVCGTGSNWAALSDLKGMSRAFQRLDVPGWGDTQGGPPHIQEEKGGGTGDEKWEGVSGRRELSGMRSE